MAGELKKREGDKRGGDAWNRGIQEERKLEGGSTAERESDVKWWVTREGGSARQACGQSDGETELRET